MKSFHMCKQVATHSSAFIPLMKGSPANFYLNTITQKVVMSFCICFLLFQLLYGTGLIIGNTSGNELY